MNITYRINLLSLNLFYIFLRILFPSNFPHYFLSRETYTGTHISNTREAKAFSILSEEGIAKGIRRITAFTTEAAFKAMELASSLQQEVDAASEAEGSLLEKVFTDFLYSYREN